MAWKPRKLTFMLIPESTTPVRRLRVPRILLVLVPLLTASAIAAPVAWWQWSKTGYIREAKALRQQIATEREVFRQAAESKDQTVNQLQNQMIAINEEATRIRNKLEELKQLEEDVKRLSNIRVEPSSQRSIAAIPGQGGAETDPQDKPIAEAAGLTRSSLQNVHQQINEVSENLTDIKAALEEKRRLEQITPSIWPTTSRLISSGYGLRSDPFTRRPSFHRGLDIAGDRGDPVYATARGTVIETGYTGDYGNYVKVNHTRGIVTVYMHLSKIHVRNQETVKKGQLIGQVGSTGRSTGDHLHYEVLRNGSSVDPRLYLP